MTALPDNLTETPHTYAGGGPALDILDDILGSLRLSGGVVIDGEFSGDFCVAAEFTPGHFEPFFPVPNKLISYHYVRSGKLIVEVDGMAPVALEAGSIAILPRNDRHRLTSRAGLAPADASEISRVTAGGVHHVSAGTDGPKTDVWCGFLETAKTGHHPLLDALPPLLTLKVVGGQAEWLDSSMRFLAEQQPSSDVVAKLAELFVGQAVREYLERLPPGASGWLRGLADPAVSKALSIIHTGYAQELDIEGLAREAGVSRTVLGERFSELIGEPPMRYCARWRMRMAANMLREGKQNTANVAYAVGFNSEAAFNRAFKREFGEPPATWKRMEAERDASGAAPKRRGILPDQEVRYCAAQDGTRLAWSAVGSGPPLVKTANWLNHITFDWESPLWRHWLLALTSGHTLIRYDERGNGLSDWDTPEFSFEAFVDDLETVVDAAGLDEFDLLGVSQGASVAIAYTLRHPGRVRRLIIYGGYARGWAQRLSGGELHRREAMVTLSETGWGADNPAYRQLFTNLYVPDATPEQMHWFNDLQRISTSPANAVKLQRTFSKIDVTELLPEVTVPTLVAHTRGDQVVPISQGQELAAGIPGALFVELEGRNHILLETEPGWRTFAHAVERFLEASRRAKTVSMEAGRAETDTRPSQLFVSGTPTAVDWITRHLGEFLDTNGDLSVQLDPDARIIGFEDDAFDCAIRSGTSPPRDLEAEDLFRVDFTPMCSPDFLAKHPRLQDPGDLLHVPRISPTDPWWHIWWRHFGLELPEAAGSGAGMGAQVLDGVAAMRRQGVAMLTPLFWRDEVAEAKLVRPFQHTLDGNETYWLVYPKNRSNWPKIRRFSDWLHRLCASSQLEAVIPKITA
jgi:pimeloyl-ACP methyl ester carboxylesterase/DNA-binding transcriptional LysR family regulator/AraC-like DNA-binding protein